MDIKKRIAKQMISQFLTFVDTASVIKSRITLFQITQINMITIKLIVKKHPLSINDNEKPPIKLIKHEEITAFSSIGYRDNTKQDDARRVTEACDIRSKCLPATVFWSPATSIPITSDSAHVVDNARDRE